MLRVTGVWPESKSFSDEEIGPIPTKWRGGCDSEDFKCNRKLIGARRFYKGYQAHNRNDKNVTFNTARDDSGHGSHTLSTAGGNFVASASVFGNGNGTARGGAPKSHVATYKVCWSEGGYCYDEDILAAFDAAISDGVDVVSASLSGENTEFFESGMSIGAFHAVANGIIVVCAGGNDGPDPQTVANVEPWTLTVAASTIDREYANYVKLGNNKVLKGLSLSEFGLPSDKLYPLVNAENAKADNANATDAYYCKDGALDHNKAKGKILVCHIYEDDPINQGVEVARVGGVGMISINDYSWFEVLPETHVLPAAHVNFTDGKYILTYINHTKSPLAHISRVKTNLGIRPAPIIASFSSRGPCNIDPTILKPDISAPGVDIIAAYSEDVPLGPHDKRRTPFMAVSGTSMATPHVAGLAGLLKAIHPDWSPAAIKSAIMTTGIYEDIVLSRNI
ncbi:putative tripeptidyl-peptidase II [Lupinus albus]|uniref:Putative tripeptidyl-peptidase II n=1 Tax=Lupinus albus TaxID=3870 RepID=A0A6A4Q8U5_LUPAL|nr:putative tripeptidyl-peptidase II [Lupinus albus]